MRFVVSRLPILCVTCSLVLHILLLQSCSFAGKWNRARTSKAPKIWVVEELSLLDRPGGRVIALGFMPGLVSNRAPQPIAWKVWVPGSQQTGTLGPRAVRPCTMGSPGSVPPHNPFLSPPVKPALTHKPPRFLPQVDP